MINVSSCSDCEPNSVYTCPYCGHNCDMSAKTIYTDEDGHCNICNKDCLMSGDGRSMVPLESKKT